MAQGEIRVRENCNGYILSRTYEYLCVGLCKTADEVGDAVKRILKGAELRKGDAI